MKVTFQRRSGLRASVLGLLTLGLILIAAPGSRLAMAGTTGPPPDRDLARKLELQFDSASAAPRTFDPQTGLGAYLASAAEHSPALKAAFYDWLAAAEKTGYAGALSDPRVMYGYYLESVETRVGPQNQRLSLTQSFPWFGTLGAQKEVSTHASEAAFAQFQAEELRLFYDVTAAYNTYYYAGRELSITRENLELLKYWESVARARYRVSLAAHPDVIKSQVELGTLEDRVLRLERQLDPAATRLRSLLDLPDSVQLPLPTDIVTEEDSLDRERVLNSVQADNPNLHATLALIESQRARERVAAKQSAPSFSVGVDYIQTGPALNPALEGSGKDAWIASAGITLPVWFGKNSARKKEAAARRRKTEYAYDDLKNRLNAITVRALFEHDDALRRVRLYRDGLIPKSEQLLNATYTAYEAGEIEFLNVLDAQRQLLDFQLRFERARAELSTRRAEVEMLTGGSQKAASADSRSNNHLEQVGP
jgi:cobalt-zinc-cadmium efflux system outer membrane protein